MEVKDILDLVLLDETKVVIEEFYLDGQCIDLPLEIHYDIIDLHDKVDAIFVYDNKLYVRVDA